MRHLFVAHIAYTVSLFSNKSPCLDSIEWKQKHSSEGGRVVVPTEPAASGNPNRARPCTGLTGPSVLRGEGGEAPPWCLVLSLALTMTNGDQEKLERAEGNEWQDITAKLLTFCSS